MADTPDATMPTLDWVADSPDDLRASYAASRAALGADFPDDVDQFTVSEPNLEGLRFVPFGGGTGAPVLYFHGGGWIVGSPETHRVLCAWMAKLSGREVISARYPLAPENPFPAQPQAAIAALTQMVLIRGQVFVAGDSAGAAMAFWAESGISANLRAEILGVASFYGAFGLTDSASIRANAPLNPSLDARALGAIYGALGLKDPLEVQDWISAVGAPVLLVTAGADTLADDGAALARLATGRIVAPVTVKDQPHAFLQGVARDPVARHEMERFAAWMAAIEATPLKR